MKALLSKLRHEPVAFWGTLLAVVLAVMTYEGVDQNTLGLVGTIVTLLGIPVVRSQVTPVPPAEDPEAGSISLLEVCAVVVTVVAVLFAFGKLPL